MITIYYESIDSYGEQRRRTFATLDAAREYAWEWVGKYATCGTGYAVSDDGIGKITCRGCAIHDLFPES